MERELFTLPEKNATFSAHGFPNAFPLEACGSYGKIMDVRYVSAFPSPITTEGFAASRVAILAAICRTIHQRLLRDLVMDYGTISPPTLNMQTYNQIDSCSLVDAFEQPHVCASPAAPR